MLKTMLLGSLAAMTAMLFGLGAHGGQTHRASADSTDVVVIGCELIAPYVDGDPTDAVSNEDVARACGGGAIAKALPSFNNSTPGDNQSIQLLAKAIGNGDGKLTASDFRGGLVNEDWDDNQISSDCSIKLNASTAGNFGSTVAQMNTGFACTLDVFVFVNHDEPVTIDADAGLVTIENRTAHFVCNADAADVLVATVLKESGASLSLPPAGGKDNDCNGGQPIDGVVPPDSFANNGDGVVMFHLVNDNAKPGDVKTVRVTENDVTQTFTVNVMGSANQVKMQLAESVVETGITETVVGNQPQFTEKGVFSCIGRANKKTTDGTASQDARPRGIPGRDVADATTITAPTSTLGWAIATDQDNRILTRVPVTFTGTPPEDREIVRLGVGNPVALVTGNTLFTRDPGGSADVAAYVVICGATETGKATIDATINAISCSETGCTSLSSKDHDKPVVTVVGPPKDVTLTAANASIKCDGSETATVTAKVTDANGDNVADGVPVNFSVIARGTAKPARTVTKDGTASTQVTAFSESTEGVTINVDAGDVAIAAPILSSIRVDCAKALGSAPPPSAAGSAPASAGPARSGVHGPDTGSGGADASGGVPAWPLLALLAAAVTLVGARTALKRD